MTPRETVITALNNKQPEQIPYQIDLTTGFAGKLKEKTRCIDPETFLGSHLYREKYKKNKKVDADKELDLFGVTWMKDPTHGDVGIVCDHPLTEHALGSYKFPEVQKEFARSMCAKLTNDPRNRFRLFSITMNYFERAWSLRGMENFLMDMVLHPAFAEELLERILAHHLELLDTVLDFDFEAVYIGDDWGQQGGMIMGPPLWRKFIKPGMKRMFEKIKGKGKYVCLHSCGDLREIFTELVDMGLDIYNTMQPEIYDLKRLKKEYGRHLTFYGGISTQRFLPYATPNEVRELTREVKKTMGEGGGYILAPTHAVTDDIPVKNVMAMVEIAKEPGL